MEVRHRGRTWKVTATSKVNYERAKAYIAYLIERSIANLLLSHDELVAALTVGKRWPNTCRASRSAP